MTGLIELDHISKVYGRDASEVRALDDVTLRIGDEELVAIMGSSGSGKSTCMNIVGCLDVPTSGHYRFKGLDVGSLGRDDLALLRRYTIGFVFQSFNLLARTTALENVEVPLLYREVPRRERRERAMAALAAVNLQDRARHTPSELSGGQQQRVAIARALVTEPSLLLADEPTGNLDSVHSAEIMRLLEDLHAQRGITIVMVTHEAEVARTAERVVVFKDGRIVSDGPSREVLR